jgi:hypothetical protein
VRVVACLPAAAVGGTMAKGKPNIGDPTLAAKAMAVMTRYDGWRIASLDGVTVVYAPAALLLRAILEELREIEDETKEV